MSRTTVSLALVVLAVLGLTVLRFAT